MGAVAFRFVYGRQCGASRLRDTAAARDALAVDEELFDCIRRGDLRVQLGQLIAQQIEARLPILGGGFERLEFAAAGAVMLAVLSFIFIGDALRDLLDPRSRIEAGL